ncbi:hypothetical protein [Burkholderia pyrrocinia]|uniref:hypothetical protein n=1 Tax=Burkholderia pyrrocinia TaxID=60550 RepID=UPI00158EDDCF|nr:hypothetical protein [Burkholderia pyrrocinia]
MALQHQPAESLAQEVDLQHGRIARCDREIRFLTSADATAVLRKKGLERTTR